MTDNCLCFCSKRSQSQSRIIHQRNMEQRMINHLNDHCSIWKCAVVHYPALSVLAIHGTPITASVSPQVLCKVLSGVLHFLFLCCFVWMSMEALLLFLSVRKLRQVKPNDRAGPHWRYKLLIGYGIPLVIVAVSAGVMPDGYGSQQWVTRWEQQLQNYS